MATIRSLAAEHYVQPYVIRSLVDLPESVDETDELHPDTETAIREAWYSEANPMQFEAFAVLGSYDEPD